MNAPSLLRVCVAPLLAVMFTGLASAGGSISYQDGPLPLLRKEPKLLAFLEQTLEIYRTAIGVRLGPSFGERQGERIPPFECYAKPKGQPGPYTFKLIISDAVEDGLPEADQPKVTVKIVPLKEPVAFPDQK